MNFELWPQAKPDSVRPYGFLDTGRPNPEVEWPGTWERLGMPPEPNHAPKKVNLT
jgi:hypothetical protein